MEYRFNLLNSEKILQKRKDVNYFEEEINEAGELMQKTQEEIDNEIKQRERAIFIETLKKTKKKKKKKICNSRIILKTFI